MDEKYYLVRVSDLKWGVIERKIEEIKTAKLEYARLKRKFKDVSCSVILLSVEDNKDGYIEKVIYKKSLSPEATVRSILEDMINLVEQFNNVCKLNQYLLDSYDVAPGKHKKGEAHRIFHGLELLKLSQTTGEERDKILYNLEESLSIRRSAKQELDYAKYANGNIKIIVNAIKSIMGNINSDLKKTEEYNASKKSIRTNEAYFNSLDLDYKEFYPEQYEPLKDDYLNNIDEILDTYDDNVVENDNYEDYEEQYAHLYV
ncbi:MAG: hypothetical protein ACRDB0_04200 [Paraclostridium sp.]